MKTQQEKGVAKKGTPKYLKLGLGGGFYQVLRFPPPVTTG